MSDNVNHPKHYTSHPSGIECIQITRHMSFNIGNAVKYLWRADEKGNALEDLQKARWYIDDEIKRREMAELERECEEVRERKTADTTYLREAWRCAGCTNYATCVIAGKCLQGNP
jgi:hypothetical protein